MIYFDQIAMQTPTPQGKKTQTQSKKTTHNEDSLYELKKTQKQKYMAKQNNIKLLQISKSSCQYEFPYLIFQGGSIKRKCGISNINFKNSKYNYNLRTEKCYLIIPTILLREVRSKPFQTFKTSPKVSLIFTSILRSQISLQVKSNRVEIYFFS